MTASASTANGQVAVTSTQNRNVIVDVFFYQSGVKKSEVYVRTSLVANVEKVLDFSKVLPGGTYDLLIGVFEDNASWSPMHHWNGATGERVIIAGGPTPTPGASSPTPAPTPIGLSSDPICAAAGIPGYSEVRSSNTPYHRAAYVVGLTETERSVWLTGGDPRWVRDGYYDRILPSSQACHGTSEEILEWAAITTGLSSWDWSYTLNGATVIPDGRNILKAVAYKESAWNQQAAGDLQSDTRCAFFRLSDPTTGCFGPPTYPNPDKQSWSWVQIKRVYFPDHGGVKASSVYATLYLASLWTQQYDQGIAWAGGANKGCPWCIVSSWFQGGAATGNEDYPVRVKTILRDREWEWLKSNPT